MKRLMTILVLIVFVSFFQTSCGDKSSKPISGDSLKSISVNKKDFYVSAMHGEYYWSSTPYTYNEH